MEQNRFKSPVLWSSLASQVLAMLIVLGVIDTGMSDAIKALVVALLDILALFGIVNNPTSKNTL